MGSDRFRQTTKNDDGFTLVELLVVMAILVLLAAVATPQVLKYLDRAKTDTAKVDINNIGSALDIFKLDVGRYPTSSEGLEALVVQSGEIPSWNGPYLKRREMLLDPWRRPYRYVSPGAHGEYDLYTLGADNAEGGEGANRDVTSW